MNQYNTRQYQVEHHTAYHYSEPVMLSHQQLHLTPRTLTQQTTQTHDLAFVPAPTLRREFIDPFGNPMTEIAIESAHHNLYIFARTRVKLSELDKIESSA